MSVQVRRRREAASFLSTFVGAQGELLVDTTNNRVQVHDGTTPGGWPAAKLADATSAVAITGGSIAGTPISGSTGSFTSLSTSGNLTMALASPQIFLNKSASGSAALINGQTAGVLRWALRLGDGTAESGSNSGSNFVLASFDDTGAALLNPIAVTRASGIVTLSSLSVTNVATFNAPITLKSYTVATLPAPALAGRQVYCTNARMMTSGGSLEGAGAGTGGLVTDSGSAWRVAGTNITAAA